MGPIERELTAQGERMAPGPGLFLWIALVAILAPPGVAQTPEGEAQGSARQHPGACVDGRDRREHLSIPGQRPAARGRPDLVRLHRILQPSH